MMSSLEIILNRNLPISLQDSRWESLNNSLNNIPNRIIDSFKSSLKEALVDNFNFSGAEFKEQYQFQVSQLNNNMENYFS
jgi:hypothetical protein